MIDSIKKFMPQNFRDFLAVILIVGIVILWSVQATTGLSMPDTATGALIVTWTLVIQFYFRKKEEEKKNG